MLPYKSLLSIFVSDPASLTYQVLFRYKQTQNEKRKQNVFVYKVMYYYKLLKATHSYYPYDFLINAYTRKPDIQSQQFMRYPVWFYNTKKSSILIPLSSDPLISMM